MTTKVQSSTLMPSILLVEDYRLVNATLSDGLVKAGYIVNTVESVVEAKLRLENNERPDLVLLDVRLPGPNGLDLTKRLNDLNIPFILLTAYNELDSISKTSESGAMGYLVKPVGIDQVLPSIQTALSRAQELQKLKGTKHELQTALDSDRELSVAVGIMMDQHHVGKEEAMKMMRKMARSQRIKLSALALSIVNARETLNSEIDT